MNAPQEFHYRLPYRVGGWRPGAHPGTRLGAGQEFVSHMSLYARPDPRLRRHWLAILNVARKVAV